MAGQHDLAAEGRAIVDANLYVVLGTADQAGLPWVSPVYYAPVGYRELLWVSRPDARHSQNLRARPELSIVIFDSSVPISTGQAVYMSAVAHEVADDDRERAVEIFSRRGLMHGGRAWSVQDVQPPAAHRLYRATAVEQYVLDERDCRVPVAPLAGRSTAAVDVYPGLTYRDVRTALAWLANAFGVEPRIFGDEAAAEVHHAALLHGDGTVLVESERPEDLHGSHTGQGWVYLAVDDVDAHYQRARAAGVEVLNEPHDALEGTQRGYSARDLEGNLWSFGTSRPTR